jgi:hypothetical protein
MLETILRNYRNASRQVSISLRLDPKDGTPGSIFEYRATALEIHRLASRAHRHLLAQARTSTLSMPRGRFEDIAWMVAMSVLMNDASRLKTCGPDQYGMSLAYLCFLTEYVSKDWAAGESRDVFVSKNGDVSIYWIGDNLSNDYFKLGNYFPAAPPRTTT